MLIFVSYQFLLSVFVLLSSYMMPLYLWT